MPDVFLTLRPADAEPPDAAAGDSPLPTLKAFTVLRAVSASPRPVGVSELAVLLGMPKATVHRIVRMLEREGLLERQEGGRRYASGGRLLGFAFDIVAASVRNAPRHAILEAVSRRVGETCNLGVMAQGCVLYIDRVEAAWPFGLRFEIGSRVPLHCTAIGKLFLSSLPPARLEAVLEGMPLDRYTDNTITDPDRLRAELERIREDGVSVDNQEFLAGVVCVAVPVTGPDGTIAAGLAVSAPNARLSLKQAVQHAPALREAAAHLGQMMRAEGE